MAQVNFTEIREITKVVAQAKLPILIRGRHGIGKSSFVYQIAKELPAILGIEGKEALQVVEIRASQLTEGDLVGLPYKGEEIGGMVSTKFMPPEFFLRCAAEPCILFFDEVDRAVSEVRQGIFQINDSRMLNGVPLHKDSIVIACVNGGIHGSQYQVGEMDPAELDRYTVFDLEPDTEEWLNWIEETYVSKGYVSSMIPNFIRMFESALENKNGAFEPGKTYPSRRSWTRFGLAVNHLINDEKNDGLVYKIAEGFVGESVAAQFRSFLADQVRVIDPEQVIYEGKVDALEEFSPADIENFVQSLAHSEIMTKELTLEQVDNMRTALMKYVPAESMSRFFMACVHHGENLRTETLQALGWDNPYNKDTQKSQWEALEEKQEAFCKHLYYMYFKEENQEKMQEFLKQVEAEKKAQEEAEKKAQEEAGQE